MQKRTLITVGADPELFLEHNEGYWKSAIDLIGGTKYTPRPLGNRKGFFVQEDNVAIEFNIPPAKSCRQFVESIHWSVKKITKEVKVFGCKPSITASALFSQVELQHPNSHVFGCDPDFNAWKDGRRNPRPRSQEERLRSCGGHIHVGYPKDSIDYLKLIKLMDLYLGVPSIMMDEDEQRRKLYGKAGAFRPQPWGVEYRTLSNFWLKSKTLTQWAYEQTIRAVKKAQELKGDKFRDLMERFDLDEMIPKCINRGNVRLAHNLITHHDLMVV